ncbi:ScyD/ScyE family protein [Pseudokineococcus sp. 5B2Z-1]|uniref:ScyD/ScyE family protein n=1 Tax=Pseudokineococcus sp. 5B2Z-1 TaxID=3132744 RepID=UPI0030ACCDF9
MDEPVSAGPVTTSTSSTRRSTARPGGRRALAGGAVIAAAAALALIGAPAASAHSSPRSTVLADGLVGPLTLAVTPRGDVVVGQAFAGVVTRIDRHGRRTDLVSYPGEEVEGVSASGSGVVYTHSRGVPSPDAVGLLERVDRRGRVHVLADLAAHERSVNPDGDVVYGLRDASAECLAQLPAEFPGRYTGEVDPHPYATASWRGRTVVADAGANALLSVDRRGRVGVLAVLPAQPSPLPAEVAAASGLPDCVVGQDYWFEPVPTDVETGPDGALYASLLPGGPEDPSFGARGSVVRVDPRTGAMTTVLDGLLGATDVAVGDDGTLYAAELFGGRVVALAPGADEPTTVLEAEQPAAVEVSHGDLYVTTQALGPAGQVVRVDL